CRDQCPAPPLWRSALDTHLRTHLRLAQAAASATGPPTGYWPEVDEPLAAGEQIVCIESLGGVLKRYERRAA
ncbi:MAG: hypothetical protein KF847_05810, partial [Pirellulales bacterium]|nr:hypothetical protein [Pirellulales bacterium]